MKYMKQIVIILIFMCTSMLVESQTLTGGVVYTVESAREAAFSGIEYEISMEPYKEYMKDPGFTAGEGGKKARISKRGRIEYYSDGSYSIRYKNNKNIVFYYLENGQLEYIEKRIIDEYPAVVPKYDINGKLVAVIYITNYNESFVYDVKKKLLGHWIDTNCYDAENRVISTRFR